jgi:hypothetical protein
MKAGPAVGFQDCTKRRFGAGRTYLPCLDIKSHPTDASTHSLLDNSLDDPTMIERLEYLRNKANDGNLSAKERNEYEEFVEANDLLMLLRETACSVLRQHG